MDFMNSELKKRSRMLGLNSTNGSGERVADWQWLRQLP